ncbi:MAG: nicotinate (nicotinamide) nucleotide adenylyltransferase [Deltaproteobacteria bacterium]|nr:nicotinate (nicotinamide) nucleotide adenylyltransferase [Deltaproteobacteria bacterium]
MRIALLGGSFNPPHVGHLMNAYYVLATREVDRVWLMPVFRHPFAKRLAPFEDRVRMCELAAARFSGGIEVSRVEAEAPGSGRTVETLDHLIGKYPEHQFSLVIGTDILPERSKWKDFDRIERMAAIIVVPRAGFPAPGVVGPALPEVSSTEIREKLARAQDVSALVPREVLAYARERGLYRAP